jgi:hypothetical protein
MNKFLAGITVVWISCQLTLRVCAQPTTAFAQPLTKTEQARLLGLVISKGESPPILLINSSDYHIAQAKSLLGEMDQLKPDGTRSGNPLLKKILYHLERARQSGVSYESSLNEIYRDSPSAAAMIQGRKEQLIKDMKTCRQLGLVTPENMERLEQGLAPVVTQGNAKYIGEPVEIDHRVPIRGPNGRPIYENEPANLQLLPKSINREKWANIDEISRGHEAKLDRAYWADRNTFSGGVIGSGFGLLLLYTSGSALLADLNAPHDDPTSKLRIGENTSLFVSGGAMTAVGISEIGSRFVTSDRALSVFSGVTKWGGRVSLVGIIIAEPIALGLDYQNWDYMTTGQHIGSVVQHGINIGAGTYTAYRIYQASRAASILATGLEAAGAEEAEGAAASAGEASTVVGAPAVIPTEVVDQAVVIVTLAGTVLAAGGQYAYDYFHPIPPNWNSSAFSVLSQDQKRQVEDSIYLNYGVAR